MKREQNEAFLSWLLNKVCQDEKKTAIDINVMTRCHFNSSPQPQNRLENKLWKSLYTQFLL